MIANLKYKIRKTINSLGYDVYKYDSQYLPPRRYVNNERSTLDAINFHRWFIKKAEILRAGLESERGPTDPRLIKCSDEYATDVLGWVGYSPYLRLFAATAGEFREGWMPPNYYGEVVDPVLKGAYGATDALNALAPRILQCDVIPDLAYYINGNFYTRAFSYIKPDDLKDYLFQKTEKVVFKLDNSVRGLGVYVFDWHSFDVGELSKLNNGVIQDYIDQHEKLARFTPKSVATIRFTTAGNGKDYSVRAVHLRLSLGSDTHVRSANQVRIPVDVSSGKLRDRGYMPDWTTTERHPNSGIAFAGESIPQFAKCIEAALALQKTVPFVHCIGWDLTVDNNGAVKLIEWNNNNSIDFSEAVQGPCFADLGWESLWKTDRFREIPK